jgi:hypothetical protein
MSSPFNLYWPKVPCSLTDGIRQATVNDCSAFTTLDIFRAEMTNNRPIVGHIHGVIAQIRTRTG